MGGGYGVTTVIAWIVEATWPACVEAVRGHAPDDARVVLLHVPDPEAPAAAHGAFAGLLGRGGGHDPGAALTEAAAASGRDLLAAAAERLGRPCETRQRTGRVEREVVAAAEGADLLVLARDGDRTRLGPHSLGPHSRFIVDHAPCPVLLVWPTAHPPSPADIPPPPDHPGHPHRPHQPHDPHQPPPPPPHQPPPPPTP
jgi:nucleotide-binding universal stress UspA family protein